MRLIDADELRDKKCTGMNPFKTPQCMQYAYNGSLAYSEHCRHIPLIVPPLLNEGKDDVNGARMDGDTNEEP